MLGKPSESSVIELNYNVALFWGSFLNLKVRHRFDVCGMETGTGMEACEGECVNFQLHISK